MVVSVSTVDPHDPGTDLELPSIIRCTAPTHEKGQNAKCSFY